MRIRFAHYCVLVAVVALLVVVVGCGSSDDSDPSFGESAQTAQFDGQQGSQWVEEVLSRIEADAVSPPVASRILAYIGIGLYESTVDGVPRRPSLGIRVQGLDEIPPIDGDQDYDVVTMMHATLGHLAPLLFEESESQEHLIDVAEGLLEARYTEISSDVWTRSANRGVRIAGVISSRMANDGYYDRRDRDFYAPDFAGGWEPVDGEEPLEPNWRHLEPFALSQSDACRPQPPVRFSTRQGSHFYEQAQAVVDNTAEAGSEQEEIAEFWADDPGNTATPPGHWMEIAVQIVDDQDFDLARTAELFAVLGIAGADAFISCWDEKYRSYLIRPVTYIQRHIDADWETVIGTPPFPEYTSGHANVSGASAAVMTELVGEMSFEDRSHEDRGLAPRSFDSFEDAAREAGQSRIYGGVHYPMANEEGLAQGRCVAETVLDVLEPGADQ